MAGDTQNAGWAAKCPPASSPPPEPLSCLVVASRTNRERHPQQSPGCAQAPAPWGRLSRSLSSEKCSWLLPRGPWGQSVLTHRPEGQATPLRPRGQATPLSSPALPSFLSCFSKNIYFNPSPTPSFLQQMLTSHQLSVLGLKLPGEWPDFTTVSCTLE